jgi:hypothetical protein
VSTRGWPLRESWRGGHRRSRAHQLAAASSSVAADGRQHRCNRGRWRRPREAGTGRPGDREGRWPAGSATGAREEKDGAGAEMGELVWIHEIRACRCGHAGLMHQRDLRAGGGGENKSLSVVG